MTETKIHGGERVRGYYGMPRPELTGDTLLQEIERIRIYAPGYDDYQMAACLGLPLEIYKGRLAVAQSERLAKLPRWELGAPLTVEGDALIVGDVHCPFTDWTYASLVTQIGKKYLKKPRQLVIAGDFFNLDIFSDYAKLVSGPGWHDEKKAAQRLAQEWAGAFDKVYYLSGNHDRRVSRRTDGEMNIYDLAEFLSVPAHKFTPSIFGYATMNSGGVSWRITHTREYSVNRLMVAGELALKYQTHVCSFHEHHLAMGWDRFHRYVVVNGGSLVDQSQLAYCSLDDSKRPMFDTGFVLLRNGVPSLFGKEPFCDWSKWL